MQIVNPLSRDPLSTEIDEGIAEVADDDSGLVSLASVKEGTHGGVIGVVHDSGGGWVYSGGGGI